LCPPGKRCEAELAGYSVGIAGPGNPEVWSVCSHDHATVTAEAFSQSKGKWLGDFIRRAKGLGVRFVSPATFYEERRALLSVR
jgi:hypothetical protein